MAETFLQRALGILRPGRAVTSKLIIGAFGKHPGHDEHFEDLDGQVILSKLREQLYTNGVQAAVDTGVWKQLKVSKIALPYRHTLIWRTTWGLMVGRMIASQDKLGRDRYPLMVVAVCPPGELEFALQRVLPWVEKATHDCAAAADLPAVKAVIQRARASAPQLPQASHDLIDPQTQTAVATAYLSHFGELGADFQGLINILYQVDREMSAFAPVPGGTSLGKIMSPTSMRSPHLRVPRCGETTAQAVAAWLRLLRGLIADDAPILLMVPDPDTQHEAQPEALLHAWVDIIVGIPTEAEFFCLRSSLEVTPCTSDIPYTIPPDFEKNAREQIKSAQARYPAPVDVLHLAPEADAIDSSSPSDRAESNRAGSNRAGSNRAGSGRAAATWPGVRHAQAKTRWLLPLVVFTAVCVLALLGWCVVAWIHHHAATASGSPSAEPPQKSPGSVAASLPGVGSAPSASQTISQPSPQSTLVSPSIAALPAVPTAVSTQALDQLKQLSDQVNQLTPGPQQQAFTTELGELKLRTDPLPASASDARQFNVQVMELSGRIKASLEASHQEMARQQDLQRQTYLEKVRQQQGPFKSAALNQAWCDHRDSFLAANPLLGFADLKAGMDGITASLAAIEQYPHLFDDLDVQWPAHQPAIDPLHAAVTAAVNSHRNQAVKIATAVETPESDAATSQATATTTAVASTHPTLSAKADRACESFIQWQTQIQRLSREAVVVDQQLSLGTGVDEPLDDPAMANRNAGDIAKDWKAGPLLSDASLREAINPMIERVESLARMSSNTRQDLVSCIGSSTCSFEDQLAAWRALGASAQQWPQTDAEWKIETQARQSLLSQVAKLHETTTATGEPALQAKGLEGLLSQINTGGADRWMRFAIQLPSEAAEVDQRLSIASNWASRSGIDPARLPAWLRYDLALATLHSQLSTPKASADEGKLHDALAAFCDSAAPTGLSADLVAQVRTQLASAVSRTDGPAVAGYVPRQVSPDEIIFTPPPSAISQTALHFVRVRSADHSVRYLCTTEMSVGVFIAAVECKGAWDQLKPLVHWKAMSDGRLSPRTWVWKDDRMQVAPSWLPPHMLAFSDYPMELAGTSNPLMKSANDNDPAPTADQPIQYISTKSAVYVASLLGCRLPTAAEWTLASKLNSASAAAPSQVTATADAVPASQAQPESKSVSLPDNLRDATWDIERNYLAGLKPEFQDSLPRLDQGIFISADQAEKIDAEEPASAGTRRTPGSDDGVLWFRRVGLQVTRSPDSSTLFSDLVGNVAEIVTQEAIAPAQWPTGATNSTAAKTFVDDHAQQFRVIGGSAFSSPRVPVNQPLHLDPRAAERGFSDVGFRLAFTATQSPFADRALAVTDQLKYLPPEKTAPTP